VSARRRALVLAAGALAAAWLGAAARDGLDRWIATTDLPPLVAPVSAELLARDGTLLRAYQVGDGRWRLDSSLAGTDPRYIAALIAYEDKRFYRHHGVDPLALARAAGQALWHGQVISGGSTLTMQVARLLEDGPTGSWAGKLRQARVALALERRLDKQAILGLYLDRAPFGGNLEGLRSATFAWFGKEPARLTPAEIALLVALPQSPAARNPARHPQAARAARARVLARLANAGAITEEAAQAALRDPLPAARRDFPARAAHLADRLRAADPGAIRIATTINAPLQARLETLAARAAAARPDLSAAILVADHRSGEILASVGSPAYAAPRQGYVDMTQALRSPGSTLKPLIYGIAFDLALAHPDTLIDDRPMRFDGYAPQNFDGGFRGTLPVREALALSLNVPAVALTEAIGPARLMARLRRSGAAPALEGAPGLAVALGGIGLSLQDMVQLYAALGNEGRAVALHAVPGEKAAGPRLISPEAAWQVGHVLSGIAPPPGAARARIAYKTGTSYGHRDALAIGYDGAHVIGVWLGRPDGTPVPGAFGGELAAPILFEAFSRLKPQVAPLGPPPPATLLGPHLPEPLRAFRPRDALFRAAPDAPQLAFPPDGAVVGRADTLVLKVARGAPPFTWLVNGRPLAPVEARETLLPWPGQGFVTLSVIDAQGRAARASVRLE